MTADVDAALARAFQGEWGRIVATLIRLTGDWDLAEESTQDAFARALERWGREGIPDNPGAWLTTTAHVYQPASGISHGEWWEVGVT